jgi:hypothetical protein
MSAGVKVKSPRDRPLTANEVDANPSILRHPDAPVRTRNRSGQKGGASKGNFDEPYVRIKYTMKESPAWRALSLSARRVLDRIEIEFGKHKGKPETNGEIIVTYEDFVAYGVGRNEIGPATRELVALGFVRITRAGVAGNADQRQATMFLLTYQPNGSAQYVEDGWKRIKTDEEAEAFAKAARERKGNMRARELGRKGGSACWAKNKIPVMDSRPRPVMDSRPQNAQKGGLDANFPVMESRPLSRISRGRAIDDDTEALGELIGLQWSAPRRDIPGVVWPIDVAFPINGHSIDMPGSPRAIIRAEAVQ